MKEEIVKIREVWIIFVMLVVIIILLLINKFPINIEIKENKQVWEANCNYKCESQEANPMPKLTIYSSYNLCKMNATAECRTCWE